jgi:hypothetical protein
VSFVENGPFHAVPLAKIAWSGQKQNLCGPGRGAEIVGCRICATVQQDDPPS